MSNLYAMNTAARFWKTQDKISSAAWQTAICEAAGILPDGARVVDCDGENGLAEQVLGEGQFGPRHWQLSYPKQVYYNLKPLLPRPLIRLLRQSYRAQGQASCLLNWPIEDRYARFLWGVIRCLLHHSGKQYLRFIHFWPQGCRCAFVLTHDVEAQEGQAYVRCVADLDAKYGFRSSFNFVPERYSIDGDLLQELSERGFEIGLHGLKHDGKLFTSREEFNRRAARINRHLKELGACGFRSPLTHRNPEWMQALEIDYDLSFFDTDPYEPIPGGTMSIWPFFLGRFVELPYTLVQDYTLASILGEKTPRLWFNKVDFIKQYSGMILLNTHPDYLRDRLCFAIYEEFLQTMAGQRGEFWHALPRDVARWWRARTDIDSMGGLPGATTGQVSLSNEKLMVSI